MDAWKNALILPAILSAYLLSACGSDEARPVQLAPNQAASSQVASGQATPTQSPTPVSAAQTGSTVLVRDTFDTGICMAPCPLGWADTQEIDGRVEQQDGVLLAQAAAREGRVPKAGLIARPGAMMSGRRLEVGFNIRIPEGVPINSIHLLDVECAECGVSGNPGVRLYLRHGRLRMDRSKIFIEHAWTNEAAPQLQAGQWHRVDVALDLSSQDDGGVRVLLDGELALDARGRTLLEGSAAFADRIQFGITATSNDVPVRAEFDDFVAEIK